MSSWDEVSRSLLSCKTQAHCNQLNGWLAFPIANKIPKRRIWCFSGWSTAKSRNLVQMGILIRVGNDKYNMSKWRYMSVSIWIYTVKGLKGPIIYNIIYQERGGEVHSDPEGLEFIFHSPSTSLPAHSASVCTTRCLFWWWSVWNEREIQSVSHRVIR